MVDRGRKPQVSDAAIVAHSSFFRKLVEILAAVIISATCLL